MIYEVDIVRAINTLQNLLCLPYTRCFVDWGPRDDTYTPSLRSISGVWLRSVVEGDRSKITMYYDRFCDRDKERVSWECMEGSFNPEFEMLRNASRSRSHLN